MTAVKTALHPLNPFAAPYPLAELVRLQPALAACLTTTPDGRDTVNFADPAAVQLLNTALLQWQFGLSYYQIPPGYLCPAVPGRLDYLLYLNDLLTQSHQGKKVPAAAVQLLDIGCGANLIYALLAAKALRWQAIGSDIDAIALQNAASLVEQNGLQRQLSLRQQANPQAIFHGVIQPGDYLDLTLCNPPFHDSPEAAAAGSARKQRNLGLEITAPLNFAGQANELWCEGGEPAFLRRMLAESKDFAHQVYWFSTLVSKQQHLPKLQQQLQQLGATQVQVITMAQGNKQSRILAWSFLTPELAALWQQHRWRRR
jgi:23S rRNA (adenine1618-N6)-methyltransferase